VIAHGFAAFHGRRVLLLQGPLGPFFARLARDLRAAGASVSKINFNGGDSLFFPRGAVAFRGGLHDWPAFLERFVSAHAIDALFLFGDCRPHHRAACELATRRGIDVYVFEEGYVRPDYITLERSGVNGRSQIPRSQIFYRNVDIVPAPKTRPVGNTFWLAAAWAICYYIGAVAMCGAYPLYRHHRPLTLREALPWLRACTRKIVYALRERDVTRMLTGALSGRFFLVPLQVHTDAQVQVHSRFGSVSAFIEEVMSSFAAHAPEDTMLIVKHHPLDRGYHDYAAAIRSLSRRLGIVGRVRYIHDQHLPTLLDHARGVVVINSTVGLSAIHHRVPVKALGTAIYDMPGLTHTGSLDDFWRDAADLDVDVDLYARFRSHVVNTTQLNGSFYRRLSDSKAATGLCWPADRAATVSSPGQDGPLVHAGRPVESAAAARVPRRRTRTGRVSAGRPG
jgi:capsular polysaccharide export protein